MNKTILIGRLTKDPELRFTPGDGKAVCRFTVAVPREFKKDKTDFINCVAWNKKAETISQYFTKGKQIAITGSIRTGSYNAQDGTKRYTSDVSVDSFEFIGSNNSNGNSDSGNNDSCNGGDDAFGGGSYNDDVTPVDSGSEMPF